MREFGDALIGPNFLPALVWAFKARRFLRFHLKACFSERNGIKRAAIAQILD